MGTITKGLIGKEDLAIQVTEGYPTETFDRTSSAGGTNTITKSPNIYKYLPGEVNARYYGDNTTSHATLSAAITAQGSNTRTIVLEPGTWTLTSALTIPSNIILKPLPGAVLDRVTFNLTINKLAPTGPFYWIDDTDSGTFALSAAATDWVYAEWFGVNTTPGTTDMTDAITSAINTNRHVRLLDTKYGHTGGLSVNNFGQIFEGSGKNDTISSDVSGTRLVKLSGTTDDLTQTGDYSIVRNLTIDNNSLGGDGLYVTSHYSTTSNINIVNQGATGYSLHSYSGNIANFDSISGYNMKVDTTLYSNFRHIWMVGGIGGYVLHVTACEKLTFDFFGFENSLDDVSIYVDTSYNVDFNGVKFESLTKYTDALIKVMTACRGINFKGVALGDTGDQDQELFILDGCFDISIRDLDIKDNAAAAVTAGRNMVVLKDTPRGIIIENVWIKVQNTFNFITASGTVGNNVYISNVVYQTGIGTNVWDTNRVTSINSNLLQTFGATGDAYIFINNSGNVNTNNLSSGDSITLIHCNNFTDAGGIACKIQQGLISSYQTVASHASLSALPNVGDVFYVTGTVNITSIGPVRAGREMTLLFAGILDVTHGNNLVLAGAANFTTAAGSTIRLLCNGTNWYEVSRSTNS
ncbi:hypothetical protein [Neptuniibacter sp.]|uniref:hypothetical protein n=1 Tax=Neptuniibacter sp. TaxID=1962643 RepID=UPI00262DD207|nr:hypothetical protein [Neptuniibacter sp.]MCP4597042.1 hypothetical protein [Neptuniibacter sp.]